MSENTISLGTIQKTIDYLSKRSNDSVSYKTLIDYLKNNYEDLIRNQTISEDEDPFIAEINNTVCKGCGMCAPVCEPDAVDLIACSSAEIMSMIDALV